MSSLIRVVSVVVVEAEFFSTYRLLSCTHGMRPTSVEVLAHLSVTYKHSGAVSGHLRHVPSRAMQRVLLQIITQ